MEFGHMNSKIVLCIYCNNRTLSFENKITFVSKELVHSNIYGADFKVLTVHQMHSNDCQKKANASQMSDINTDITIKLREVSSLSL